MRSTRYFKLISITKKHFQNTNKIQFGYSLYSLFTDTSSSVLPLIAIKVLVLEVSPRDMFFEYIPYGMSSLCPISLYLATRVQGMQKLRVLSALRSLWHRDTESQGLQSCVTNLGCKSWESTSLIYERTLSWREGLSLGLWILNSVTADMGQSAMG